MAALFFVHSNICYTQKENKISGMTGIVEAAFTWGTAEQFPVDMIIQVQALEINALLA